MTTLLNLEQLAERLHTSAAALRTRHWRDQYSLPPVIKIPGDRRVFFNEADVAAWMRDPNAFKPKEKRGPGRPRKIQGGLEVRA